MNKKWRFMYTVLRYETEDFKELPLEFVKKNLKGRKLDDLTDKDLDKLYEQFRGEENDKSKKP